MDSFHPIECVKMFFRQDADYFESNRVRIRRQNGKMLRLSCLVYMAVLLLYTVFECIIANSRLLINMYFAFDAIHLALTAAVLMETRKAQPNAAAMQTYGIVFECTLLAFFAAESIFPYPEFHTFYFSIPILLVMLIFTHRAKYMLSVIFAYAALYAVFVCVFKQPAAAANDLRVAAATLIAALIGYVLVSKIRHSEGLAIKRLEYLSTTDALAGTYNRQTIETICKAYIEDVGDEKRGSYALIVIDLDDFKSINDQYGHSAGDEVLHRFGDMLKSMFYDKDNVGRYGGDEFLVLMVKDAGTVSDVQKKMSAILTRTGQIRVEGAQEAITCCIGVAYVSSDQEGTDPYDVLFARADKALYEAKAKGENQFVIG